MFFKHLGISEFPLWCLKCFIFQRKDSSQIDQYLVYGVEYKAIRDAVAKAMLEGKMERIEEACEVSQCSAYDQLFLKYIWNHVQNWS